MKSKRFCKRSQLVLEVRADAPNLRHQVVENVEELKGHAGCKRVAAESRSVHAWANRFRGTLIAGDDAERQTAGQRLRRSHDVGQDGRFRQLVSEVLAGTADAALNFIEAKQRIELVGQLAGAPQERRVERKHAAFALNPLHADASRALVDSGFECGDVVRGDEPYAGHQRFEVVAVFGLSGDGDRADGTSMEGVFERHDLVLVGMDVAAMCLDHLERAFGGLCAAVGEEGASQAANFSDTLRQRPLELVVEKVGGVDQQTRLLADCSHDPRVILTQRVDPDSSDEIEVTLAIDVPHPRPVAPMKDQRIAAVILQQILLLEFDH